MLRVGLTGGLGSGKSTVAAMLARHGAQVISADEIGRGLMQPGQAVYDAVVRQFGREVVGEGGQLDRKRLSRIAFAEGRVEELNRIVHPAVIAEQARLMETMTVRDLHAVVVVESALLLETRHAGPGGWRERFDRVILVVAADELKIARYVARGSDRAAGGIAESGERSGEARRRLQQQIPDERKAALADFVLDNNGTMEALAAQVDRLWPVLRAEAAQRRSGPDRHGTESRRG